MKIYVAGPYAARDYLRGVGISLVQRGFVVTSRWTDDTHTITPSVLDAAPAQSDEYVRDHVLGDFACIDEADVVLLFTGQFLLLNRVVRRIEETTSGGRHIETGYALARGKRVVVVGKPENIFHRGACTIVEHRAEIIRTLREIDQARASNNLDAAMANLHEAFNLEHQELAAKGGSPTHAGQH